MNNDGVRSELEAPHRNSWILAVLAAIGLVFLSVQNVQLRSENLRLRERLAPPTEGLAIGDELPSAMLVELNTSEPGKDQIVQMRNSTGVPSVYFYFTTTCPYCLESAPVVAEMERHLTANGVAFIAIALDGLARRHGLFAEARNWRVLAPRTRESASILGVPIVPTVIVADAEARVLGTWAGQIDSETVLQIQGLAIQ